MIEPEKVEQSFSLLRTRNVNVEALACLLAAFESTDERVKDSVTSLIVFAKLVDPEACNKKLASLHSGRDHFSDMCHETELLYRYARQEIDLSDDKVLRSIPEHMTTHGVKNLIERLRQKNS